MTRARLLLAAAPLLTFACAAEGPGLGAGADAGPQAGDAAVLDATPADAEPRPDAALVPDAGPVADAGSTPAEDAGVPPQTGTEVTIATGRVRGNNEGGLRVFRGIPYAEPPTGARRFRAPVPNEPWDGVLEADEFGPACPQPRLGPEFLLGGFAGPQSEDCLTLNVWAHEAEAAPRPVMVFIYGGGFVTGSSAWPLYDGQHLARTGDVVVVTLEYRVGALGFLATEALAAEAGAEGAGNMGLEDQIEALRWVQRNIAAFGGDPSNVTVFGESAGAISVCALLGAPSADALFHKAIIQSGLCWLGTAESGPFGGLGAREASEDVVRRLGCDDAADQNRCLRNLPVEDLVDVVRPTSILTGNLDALAASSPHVDGVLLSEQPIERLARGEADKPLLVGSNAREGVLFTASDVVLTRAGLARAIGDFVGDETLGETVADLYPRRDFPLVGDAWIAFLGDFSFICHGLAAARAASPGQPAFTYHFTRSPLALRAVGAAHAIELPYVFGTFSELLIVDTAADRRVSEAMQAAWTRFARTGVPADPAGPAGWPAFDPADPGIRIFADPGRVEAEIRNGRCAALRGLGLVP